MHFSSKNKGTKLLKTTRKVRPYYSAFMKQSNIYIIKNSAEIPYM